MKNSQVELMLNHIANNFFLGGGKVKDYGECGSDKYILQLSPSQSSLHALSVKSPLSFCDVALEMTK